MFRRGQELVAQRCTDVASRNLYGKALTIAASNRQVDVFEALLETCLDFDFEVLTNTLYSVCAWGSVNILQNFLQHDTKKVLGIEQFSRGLSYAARKNNHPVVVYWLVEYPEHDNLDVNPATVIDASANGALDILPPLIEHIRSKDSAEHTLTQCLQVAARKGHQGVVEYLIGIVVDINAVVREVKCSSKGTDLSDYESEYESHNHVNGSTRNLSPLQAALIGFQRFSPSSEFGYSRSSQSSWTKADGSSQEQTIEVLLDRGADPNRTDEGRYPLNLAAEYCTVNVVQKLISSGADAGAATKKHGTALQAAARRRVDCLPIIKTLLMATGSTFSSGPGTAAALNEALSSFDRGYSHLTSIDSHSTYIDSHSTSIADVMGTGSGAAVKILLANLPGGKADDSRYSILAHVACEAGDLECIELLLQRGYDANVLGECRRTALQAASSVGNIRIVDRLLKSGADINLIHGVHGTALRAAVSRGHEDLVHMLITHGADVNLCHTDEGHGNLCESVLHLAIGSKNNAIFKLLLDAGADVNRKMNAQQHILIIACEHGNINLVKLLLASEGDVNVLGKKIRSPVFRRHEYETPLIAACVNGHVSVVRLLLDHGADIEKTNNSSTTPLIAAIRGNNPLIIRLLLDAGADVNHAADVTPLSEAADKCDIEVIEDLLSAGAIIGDPSTKGNALARACRRHLYMVVELLLVNLSGTQYEAKICGEALSEAISCGSGKIVGLLMEHGASPSFEMLRQSCSAGALEVVRVLVEQDMNVNEDDGKDAPLLHVAASHLELEIVRFLISRGANVMHCSTKYGSPLVAALEGLMASHLRSDSQPEPCRSLARQLPLPEPQWSDIEIRRSNIENQWSHFKTQSKPGYREFSQCEQIVRSLLDAGAEVDRTIRKFGNALHLASYMGSEFIVRQLLERMEDANVFGGYLETPLIAGLKGDHLSVVNLLLDRHIDVNCFLPEHGSALHYACGHASRILIERLLDHGADINAYNDKHGSPLAAAASPKRPHRINGHFEVTQSYEEQRAILQMLLRHRPKVQIRECDLLVAVSIRYKTNGPNLINFFFQHDPSAVATEAVVIKAIQKYDKYQGRRDGTLRLVLEHDGGLGSTPAMAEAADTLKAAQMAEVTKILLEHKPLDKTTGSILESMHKRAALKLREYQESMWYYKRDMSTESSDESNAEWETVSRSEYFSVGD